MKVFGDLKMKEKREEESAVRVKEKRRKMENEVDELL